MKPYSWILLVLSLRKIIQTVSSVSGACNCIVTCPTHTHTHLMVLSFVYCFYLNFCPISLVYVLRFEL